MGLSARHVLVVLGVLLLGGCVQQQRGQPKGGAVSDHEIDTPKANEPRVIDMTKAPKSSARFDVDDCAQRLQEIEGELLTYYSVKGDLPGTLAELAPYADGDTTNYTCPVSHLSYVYVPTGLALANDVSQGRLILYDAKPVHDSARGPMRWGVLFSEARGRGAPKLDVIPIAESVMPGYVPVAPRPVVVPRKNLPAGQ